MSTANIGPDNVKQIYRTALGGTEFYLNMDDPYKDGGGKGTTNVTAQFNISFGHDSQLPFTKYTSGFAYSGGDGSILKNDNIHHVYFAFYSIGVGHMIIENNIIRNSGHYGLDPHTGTHDMIVRNNTIYDNNGSGIICSLNCYNILIENNKVHAR